MACNQDGKGTKALAAFDKDAQLRVHEFGRPEPAATDVEITISHCGQCASDTHASNGDWGINKYPFTPGHEIVGEVTRVGAAVKDFAVGQRVGVGCFVQSCMNCEQCRSGNEHYCDRGVVQTYGSDWPADDKDHPDFAGKYTSGGYSSKIVVNEHFVLPLPDKIPSHLAAPLLCAGITTYSPLARHILGKTQQRVGVVGFGGLGQMAVKQAKAMGAEVVVLSRSESKKAAAEAMGATLVAYTDKSALKSVARSLDLILDTVSAEHDVMSLVTALKPTKTYVLIGGVAVPQKYVALALIMNGYKLEGSLVGSISETRDMLAFCAEHDIVPEVQVVHAKDANESFQTLHRGEAGAKRFVIDIATLSEL